MRKYRGLTEFLRNHSGEDVTLSISEINDLVGGELPPSAFRHRPWWSNRSDGLGSQNRAWQSVGFETGYVDIDEQIVPFIRASKIEPITPEKDVVQSVKGLTIAQAKAGLSEMFGVPIDAIEINIRG